MGASDKLDLYKQHKPEYVTPKKPVLVEVGPAQYLTIEGQGEPGGEVFQAKVGAMYQMAFTIKMTRKSAGKGDYKVCYLEGLWWTDREDVDFTDLPPADWQWQLLIRTPDFINTTDLDAAKEALRKKKKPPQFEEVELQVLTEGLCVQMLHVGPFDTETDTIRLMHDLAKESHLTFHGRHHEIYLSDPRRTAPQKLRTILRHPVRSG